jgi:hypothetical protein
VRPAPFSDLAAVRARGAASPAAPIEDDLGRGVGLEASPEIVVEPLFGGSHDDEVLPAEWPSFNLLNRRSSQMW